jgi:hypothetical protein
MSTVLGTYRVCLLATVFPFAIAAQTADPAATMPRTHRNKTITLVGCIFGQNGKYVLMTKKSTTELISQDDLQARIGYKVRVTGVLTGPTASDLVSDDQANSITGAGKKSSERSTASHNDSNKLKVAKLDTISKGCDMKSEMKSEKSWTHILHL